MQTDLFSPASNLAVPKKTLTNLGLSVPSGFDCLVSCDGACSGNPGPGGYGIVAQVAGEPGAELKHGSSNRTTNNIMELTAAIEGLKLTPTGARVLVQTDSQYVIKGCTEWRAGWVRKGMKNSKGEAVANPDFWKALWAEVDKRKVKFQWVKGHNGDPANEMADELARRGSDEAKATR